MKLNALMKKLVAFLIWLFPWLSYDYRRRIKAQQRQARPKTGRREIRRETAGEFTQPSTIRRIPVGVSRREYRQTLRAAKRLMKAGGRS